MKNSINKIFFPVLFILTIFVNGCTDEFLTEEPVDAVVPEVAFQSYRHAQASLVGLYDLFGDYYFEGLYVPIMNDIIGEDAMVNSTLNYNWFVDAYQLNILSTYQWTYNPWAAGYKLINDANMVIEYAHLAEDASLDEINQLIGQARAMRAYSYLSLVQIYADSYSKSPEAPGLIIRTSPITNATSPDKGRSSISDVYEVIINDLLWAETNLDIYGNKGYLDQKAAQALLARAYLNMGDWENAADYARKAYEGVTLMSYEEMWAGFMMMDNNPEALFYINYTRDDNWTYLTIPSFYWPVEGYSSMRVSEDFFNLFAAEDARRSLYSNEYPDIDPDNYLVLKFAHNEVIGNAHSVKIRASEMYLIEAEAEAELGNSTVAQDAVYEIMVRSHGAAAKPTETGQALVDVVLKERRKELLGEGFRWNDIKRRNLDFARGDDHWSKWNFTSVDEDYYRLTFPIPQEEIDANTAMTVADQNTGY